MVIPTLNEAAGIAAAVERAAALKPRDVIVADGDSDDDTPAIAARYGAVVVTAPRGRGTQLNAGAAAAQGDVLLFLHADSWLEPGALRQIGRALADRRVAGGAFRQRIEAQGLAFRLLERGNAVRAGWLRLPYGDQGIFLRREVFDEVGGFPNVTLMEDVLMMKRVRRGRRLVLLRGPLHTSARRWRQHGLVRQTVRNWRLLLALQLGADPNRLARHYPPHADPATPNAADDGADRPPR